MKKIQLLATVCFFVLCVFSQSQKSKSTWTPPDGAQPATPNIVYWTQYPVTFYDVDGNTLLSDLDSYTASPAKAAWVMAPIYSYWEFPNYNVSTPQICNLNHYLQPFWKCDTIYNEQVALSGIGKTATLLFKPSKIISVTTYDDSTVFKQGVDYSLDGSKITQLNPRLSDNYNESVGTNGLSNVQPTSWTNVTYIPDRTNWGGASIFRYKGDKLPKTMAKLKAKKPLVIEAYGMSITCGNNVSGFAGDDKHFITAAPYMHSYVDLLGIQLRKHFGYDSITVINGSCGGKTAAWANQWVEAMVTPNNPDLVLLDHGMNDIWGGSVKNFIVNIDSTIAKIHRRCPDAEIILVNNMLPGTGYGSPGLAGQSRMRTIRDSLQKREAIGVANFPMTQMSDSIYARKGEKSCQANALHPNDFLARCYAQGLVAMFDETATSVQTIQASEPFLKISPNPVSNSRVVMEIPDEILAQVGGTIRISITDLQGRIVCEVDQTQSSKEYQAVNLRLSNGSMYLVSAIAKNKISTVKLIMP